MDSVFYISYSLTNTPCSLGYDKYTHPQSQCISCARDGKSFKWTRDGYKVINVLVRLIHYDARKHTEISLLEFKTIYQKDLCVSTFETDYAGKLLYGNVKVFSFRQFPF